MPLRMIMQGKRLECTVVGGSAKERLARGETAGLPNRESLKQVYRQINPIEVKVARGLKIGDTVVYKKSDRVVERAWGKIAGKIIEIRRGRSGPLLISSRGVGKSPVATHIGPMVYVAMMQHPDGSIEFSDTRDLRKV